MLGVIFNDDYRSRTGIRRHGVKVRWKGDFSVSKSIHASVHTSLRIRAQKESELHLCCFLRESLMKYKLTRVRIMYENMAGKGGEGAMSHVLWG